MQIPTTSIKTQILHSLLFDLPTFSKFSQSKLVEIVTVGIFMGRCHSRCL